MFIKCVDEAEHVIPSQVIGGLLLYVVIPCILTHTIALIEQVINTNFKLACLIFQHEPRHREVEEWNGLSEVRCGATIDKILITGIKRIVL